MSNIMFFCIPAHGHTNPTIKVVEELVKRGHRVRYFSFEEFREKIEQTGTEYVACDSFLPPTPQDLDAKVGKDFASLIEMVADTTVNMDETVKRHMEEFKPNVVVSDSVCFWGKLFAWKYGVPFVCSTTTFAFNKYTARLMKQGLGEVVRMITGMPRINAKIEMLKAHGYAVKDFVSIIQNDNDTNTIVYTSKMFQPMAETFSDKYVFVGPSVKEVAMKEAEPIEAGQGRAGEVKKRPLIYISLGTVLNNNVKFYQRCIEALSDMDCEVIISAGKKTDISKLKNVKENMQIFPYVDQMEVLAGTDVFLTHCGMNSVNESLYMGVPMVLFPQHSEEYAVAHRTAELGAGLLIKRGSAPEIRKAISTVLTQNHYRKNAEKIGRNFRKCKGAGKAAEFIEKVAKLANATIG